MQGRRYTSPYARKATDYLERELGRLGLRPAGEGGTFHQTLPVVERTLDSTSTITVSGQQFRAGKDFAAEAESRTVTQLRRVRPLYLGLLYDTSRVPTVEELKGRVVMVREPFRGAVDRNRQSLLGQWLRALAAASAVIHIVGDTLTPDYRGFRPLQPRAPAHLPEDERPLALRITTKVAEAILDSPLSGSREGVEGQELETDVRFADRVLDVARNVIAIIPGVGPLKGQYVALSAHSDHIGTALSREEHDAVKARAIMRVRAIQDSALENSPQRKRVLLSALTDSLRRVHGPPRVDSIFNGADDDASGVVTLLEIARAMMSDNARPRRSILFVWHTAEESGLLGSRYFTDHPTVPLDSIVTLINLDRIGHGGSDDPASSDIDGNIRRGGPGYVQLLGARRLSTELGDVLDAVNASLGRRFRFDASMDAPGHPQQVYCRSDQVSYARYGIPSVLVTTGGNTDYHEVTDEPQYIDYDHMADVSRLVMASAMKIANLDHRIVVDKPKPNPKGACVQ